MATRSDFELFAFVFIGRRMSWPKCSATSSTSTWLTRLDLPDPETPVTVVNTPSGNATSSWFRLLRVTPVSRSQPLGERGVRRGSAWSAEQMTPGLRRFDLLEPGGRAAVEDVAAMLARGRPDVDDPIGMADHVEIVFDDEQRIARRLSAGRAPRSSASVSAGCSPAEGSSST